MERTYLAIDLKSFYASVECRARGLDPLSTNLVVADESRTEKTICLAVTPALKAHGIPGRARLFEVIEKVKTANAARKLHAPNRTFTGESADAYQLATHPELAIGYLVAPPRMAHYMQCSTQIYQIYLQYIAPEDIHVYSIDEVFMDVTEYLRIYRCNAQQLARKILLDVLEQTGITATAGIGTNLYLCKVALDIQSKHIPSDETGVRIATLDEQSYRAQLWTHRPLTDFWRVGGGIAKKLEQNGLFTMGDIARCSIGKANEYYNEDFLYKLFGINAELLIDHAWGWEPTTIAQIKAYKPSSNSLGSGQVLQAPYSFAKARVVLREMADSLALALVDKRLATPQIVLTVGFDIENMRNAEIVQRYQGAVVKDAYGRKMPKPAQGSQHLPMATSSSAQIIQAFESLFDAVVDPCLLIRRINVTAMQVMAEDLLLPPQAQQMDLFTDYEAAQQATRQSELAREKERKQQHAMLQIKKKFGGNAILKGLNLQEGATAKERNEQIGGHKA